MTMHTDIDRNWKDRVSAQALKQIRDLDLSLDPESFELWYTFFAGRHKALTEAIDALLAATPRPTSHDIADVYEQVLFPSKAATRIHAIGAEVQTQSSRLIDVIAQASDATHGYQSRLSSAAPRLAGGGGDDGVAAIADDLLSWTIEMRATNALLVEQLDAAAAQVRRLQDELDRVRLESMTDPLTEVGNRKFFETSMARLIAAAAVDGPLSLLIVDLDNFKQFNDRHGHVVGDDVLRLAAATIKQSCRRDDVVCRYGGDEFAIILPGTALNDALAVGEKIRAAIAARELHRRSTHESLGRLLISIGSAQLRCGEAAQDFVERADHWMYAAKQAGRSRLQCSSREPQQPAATQSSILWHDSYACGEAAIDRQHRELFDLANLVLGSDVEALELDKLAEVVDLLIARVGDHFAYEEQILEGIGYFDLGRHRVEHDHLLLRAGELRDGLLARDQSLGALREFLVNTVIIGHMLHHDQQFFPLLDHRMSAGAQRQSSL